MFPILSCFWQIVRPLYSLFWEWFNQEVLWTVARGLTTSQEQLRMRRMAFSECSWKCCWIFGVELVYLLILVVQCLVFLCRGNRSTHDAGRMRKHKCYRCNIKNLIKANHKDKGPLLKKIRNLRNCKQCEKVYIKQTKRNLETRNKRTF